MNRKQAKTPDGDELRQRAEAELSQRHARETSPQTEGDLQRLLHELQVHQIELEMQNDELMQMQAELETVLRQYTDLYDFAQVGYFTLERDGMIRKANLAGASLLGIERARLVKRRFGLFVSDETRPTFNAFLAHVFESRAKETCEVTLIKEGNEPLYLEIGGLITENRQECRVVAVDITVRKRAEIELRYLSTHDALTGAYNRSFFEEEMARLERGRQFPVSIVLADVDDLKGTNDHEGHAAGDELLKRVAQVLSAAFRADEIIARIGGDEFAVLLTNTDAIAAKDALRRLQHILEEHNAAQAGTLLNLSFGVSTAESSAPLTDVLRDSDANMYRMKRGKDALKNNHRPPKR
jgi:diguanylate cyclase (GGDEF)-like protein/PAS domain S-box-containing protein